MRSGLRIDIAYLYTAIVRTAFSNASREFRELMRKHAQSLIVLCSRIINEIQITVVQTLQTTGTFVLLKKVRALNSISLC